MVITDDFLFFSFPHHRRSNIDFFNQFSWTSNFHFTTENIWTLKSLSLLPQCYLHSPFSSSLTPLTSIRQPGLEMMWLFSKFLPVFTLYCFPPGALKKWKNTSLQWRINCLPKDTGLYVRPFVGNILLGITFYPQVRIDCLTRKVFITERGKTHSL